MHNIHIFVSYTRRDGKVRENLLRRLHDHLAEVGVPFVHMVAESRHCHQQFAVIRALMRAHLLILIESPCVYRSPWVKFELLLSSLRFTPLIRLRIEDLENFLLREANHRPIKPARLTIMA